MTPHVAHEDSESVSSSSKVEELVTVQTENVPPPTTSPYRPEVDTSAVDPRKLKRKINFRLLPWLVLLFLLNYLDRGSIGNARVCTLYALTPLALSYAPFRFL
jgi:hypothetical protein